MEQNHFRELARLLSRLQGKRFAGAVIMRADWQVTDSEPAAASGLQVLKDRHGLLVACCVTGNEVLKVTMLLGYRQEISRDESSLTSQGNGQADRSTWSVSPLDVKRFTADVGDTNWIHQGNQPVIPGLLLMEKLLAKRSAEMRQLSLRFHHAMFAGTVLVDWQAGKIFQRERMTAAFHWQ
ncbi:MAG: hypothetical protein K6F01_07790 [Selenomonas sp.]|uniref:hypothetical protein n=1 Tax=Selenomonas sp. TaxID=2053611 RepID=UPI0025D2DE79|nr:hypothetical protein [Selenomonas sp.]MCR5439312.1 hypothetical protein [Selenomonas sp.]